VYKICVYAFSYVFDLERAANITWYCIGGSKLSCVIGSRKTIGMKKYTLLASLDVFPSKLLKKNSKPAAKKTVLIHNKVCKQFTKTIVVLPYVTKPGKLNTKKISKT
jgi:hypothetical protein